MAKWEGIAIGKRAGECTQVFFSSDGKSHEQFDNLRLAASIVT